MTTTLSSTDTSGIARTALRANAVFSLGTGLLLTVAPATVGGWLGVDIDIWLRLLGLGLLGHFAALLWMAQRPNPIPWARINLLMIAPYPLLMIGLAASGVVERTTGQTLVLLDGAVVGAIAIGHWLGIRASQTELPSLT
jgi:hypothetical protein